MCHCYQILQQVLTPSWCSHCTAVQGYEGKPAPDLAAVAHSLGLHQRLACAPDDDALQQNITYWPMYLPPLELSPLALPEECLASRMFNHG